MINLIIENVGPEQTGVATGINTLTRTVGGAFGGAIVASLLAGSVDRGPFPSSSGFTLAFAACAIAVALGVVVGLLIPSRRSVRAAAAVADAPAR
jgi:CBS domain containing-hemolysin-like protein